MNRSNEIGSAREGLNTPATSRESVSFESLLTLVQTQTQDHIAHLLEELYGQIRNQNELIGTLRGQKLVLSERVENLQSQLNGAVAEVFGEAEYAGDDTDTVIFVSRKVRSHLPMEAEVTAGVTSFPSSVSDALQAYRDEQQLRNDAISRLNTIKSAIEFSERDKNARVEEYDALRRSTIRNLPGFSWMLNTAGNLAERNAALDDLDENINALYREQAVASSDLDALPDAASYNVDVHGIDHAEIDEVVEVNVAALLSLENDVLTIVLPSDEGDMFKRRVSFDLSVDEALEAVQELVGTHTEVKAALIGQRISFEQFIQEYYGRRFSDSILDELIALKMERVYKTDGTSVLRLPHELMETLKGSMK